MQATVKRNEKTKGDEAMDRKSTQPGAGYDRSSMWELRRAVNLCALLSFLILILGLAASYVRPMLSAHLSSRTADVQTVAALMDCVDMFSYVCSFLVPLGIVMCLFPSGTDRPSIPFSPSVPPHSLSAIFLLIGILSVVGDLSARMTAVMAAMGFPVHGTVPSLPDTPERILLYFISSVILPAIVEELVYRGYILHLLLPFGKTFAILASGVLFALMHLSAPSLLYACVAGVIIGYYVVRGGSLWIGIFMHMINNLLTFLQSMGRVFLDESVYAVCLFVMRGCIYPAAVIGIYIHMKKRSDGIRYRPLEAGTTYTRRMDPNAIGRGICTPPMCAYLVCALYFTILNSL